MKSAASVTLKECIIITLRSVNSQDTNTIKIKISTKQKIITFAAVWLPDNTVEMKHVHSNAAT